MYSLLLLITVSYWYCLPLITQRVIGYSETRGYELLLYIFVPILISRFRNSLRIFYRQDKPGQWLRHFAVWATVTYIFTILSVRFIWSLVTLIRLFRFWAFSLSYAAFYILLRNYRQCKRLLDIFLLIGIVQAVLICLQGIGVVPNPWASTWASGYGTFYPGTLGPNRTHPGHMMILVFCVATAYISNSNLAGILGGWLARIASTCSVIALFMTGSRTAWVAFGVFCIVLLISLRRLKIAFLLLGVIFVLSAVVAVIPGPIRTNIQRRAEEMIRERVVSRILMIEEDSALAKFQSVDAGRYVLWVESLKALPKEMGERPWRILVGTGFNNYLYSAGVGESAHNMFITLLYETGLVGLVLYIRWLIAMWRKTSILIAEAEKARRHGENVFVPITLKPLLIAITVSLFAGEILYIYLPCFSFMGAFLFIYAVMQNPALIYPERKQTR